MPLIRVTPENAVDTVRDQIGTLREALGAAGRTPAFEKLQADAEELTQVLDRGTVEVELLSLGGLHPQWTGSLSQWLDVDPAPLVQAIQQETLVELPANPQKAVSVVRIRGPENATARRAGERTPPILVVAGGRTERPDKSVFDAVVSEISERPLTLVVAPKEAEWAKALAGLGSRESKWVCKAMEIEQVANLKLADNLERPPWPQAAPIARAWSVTGALASLHQAFSAALEIEERSIRVKRATVEQRSVQQSGPASPTEVMGELRTYLQKQFDQFQKGVTAELKDIVAPYDGKLTREIDGLIEQFDEFEVTKKPKRDVLNIPQRVIDELLQRVAETLGAACRASLMRMRDLMRDIVAGVEKLVERKGGPPVAVHVDHLPQQRLENIVERGAVLQKPYKGEVTRRGPMDYFMAARRYQMLFFMVFSAFGLSFIRSYREFTIPIGIVLMAFGMINVINGARKQRAEAEEKELDKARDLLRSDMNRAMTEIQKNWEQALSTHISEQQAGILESVERTLKSVSDQASRAAAENKELVQQQMKSLDGAQRKIAEGIKRSEAAVQDLDQLGDQIVEIFVGVTNPSEAPKPGVPGAPGAARPTAGAGAKPGGAAGASAPKAPPMPEAAAAALNKLKQGQAGGSAAGKAGDEAKKKLEELKAKGPGASAGRSAAASSPAAGTPASSAGSGGDAAAKMEELKAKMAAKLGKAKGKVGSTAAKGSSSKPKAASGPGDAPAAGAAKEAASKLEEMKKRLKKGSGGGGSDSGRST